MLYFGGYLNISGSNITYLPDGLSVGGDLCIDGTKITSLPKNMEIGENLDLVGTKVVSIPEGLKLKGDLYLNSGISYFCGGIEIYGKIIKE